MKLFLSLGALFVYFVLVPPALWSGPNLIEEPPLSMHKTWNSQNNGMIFVGYDTDQNGEIDFYTLRVVVFSCFSKESVADFALNYPENHIFFISYETSHYYYVAVQKPLFYALDVDEDGQYDLIYKDPMEDGVNGNEIFYDSPSGKFSDPGKLIKAGPLALHETVRK